MADMSEVERECWCIWPYPTNRYGYDMNCPTHPIRPFMGVKFPMDVSALRRPVKQSDDSTKEA